MQEILNQAKQFIDNISQRKLDSLCSTSITKREKAIHGILNWLDANNENSWAIFQAIPIELVSRQEEIAALYFAETNIKNGNIFGWEIIESIITAAIKVRKEIYIEWDIETVSIITRALHTLFRTLLEVDIYRSNPKSYLLMGADAEYIGNSSDAIDIYTKAKELNSIESYHCIAAIYELQHNYSEWIALLEEWYASLWDISFLQQLVRMYYRNNNHEIADARYTELKKITKEKVSPFIVYKWSIDSDIDLDTFEELMLSYLSEWILEPNQSLTELAISASLYISNQIELINIDIERFDTVSDSEWTSIHRAVYMCLITRRLFLMQHHIIVLRDSRYLEAYLDDINTFAIYGNDKNREDIGIFFDEYFSKIVLSEQQRILEDQSISVDKMNLFGSIRVHIFHMAAIFWQWSLYDVILEKMDPMVRKCLELECEPGDIPNHFETENQLQPLRDENDFFTSLPIWLQKSYEEFIEFFDKKYGIYYRRNIQIFARDSEYNINTHTEVLKNYSDVALLFWIEKISAWGLSWDDLEPDMEDLIKWYHLNTLEPINVLLFAGFLLEWESQYECVIELLINTPWIFDFPNALCISIESLLHLDSIEDMEQAISMLNKICREQYDSLDFFEQIDHIFLDIISDSGTSDEEISSSLFTLAYRYLLQENIEQALVYFQEAGKYEPMRSYREIGDMYFYQWDHKNAIESYEKFYLADPSTVGISRLISCYIELYQFDTAKEYIDRAIWANHAVSSNIFAYHLWQWNEKKQWKK